MTAGSVLKHTSQLEEDFFTFLCKIIISHRFFLLFGDKHKGDIIRKVFQSWDIHHLVHELANQGLAVIIISDDLAEVVVNCSRVVVMKAGKIVGEMKGKDITEDNIREIIM